MGNIAENENLCQSLQVLSSKSIVLGQLIKKLKSNEIENALKFVLFLRNSSTNNHATYM